MYVVPPPKRPDPLSGSVNGSDDSRIYQTWKGSNIFFLQGRFILGSSLAMTILSIVFPVSAFCAYVARELMDDFSSHLGILIMVGVVVFTFYVLVLLLLTYGRDPGIIPRNAHPPESEGYDGIVEGGGQTPQLRLPRIKEVEVNGITVKFTYCDTCMLYRPPRCSHCSICNNCVERFDQHSPWVGQCIGLRNYRCYFMFLFSATLLCIYVFGFCWVYMKRIMVLEDTTIWKAMIKNPVSIALMVYTFIFVWFVGGLAAFHLYLISTNQTTYEYYIYQFEWRTSPYNRGVMQNFKEIFCTSIPPSKVPWEPKVPTPSVGGGFVSPNMGKAVEDIEMDRKAVWSEVGGGVDNEGQRCPEH